MKNNNQLLDIYFEPKYSKINEFLIEGETQTFEYEDDNGRIIYTFIVRKIPFEIEGVGYYDITSPYGYGDPIILKSNNEKELIKNFMLKFDEYCLKNNIISEFIRFHPVEQNHFGFEKYYDVEFNRKTLGINLKDYENPFLEEFSRSTRKRINRQIREGMTFKLIKKPNMEEVKSFYKVYTNTMDRNEASNFYYFPLKYFEDLNKEFNENILLINIFNDNELIASGYYFVYGKYMHAHLSGTIKKYLKLSPAYMIRYAATIWGKENGYEMIHGGGGVTTKEDDSLFIFKKRFSQKTEFDFYLGKRIINKEVYDLLIEINKNENENYFPLYRT